MDRFGMMTVKDVLDTYSVMKKGHSERRDCDPDRTEKCCGIGQDTGSAPVHEKEDPEETGQETQESAHPLKGVP